jgi:heat shock protein HslJ
MPEVEKAFTDALERAAGQAPVGPGLDAAELVARAGRRRGTGVRWLAAAAAVVLVAGVAVGAVLLNNRNPTVTAVPAARPTPSASAALGLEGTTWELVSLAGRTYPPNAGRTVAGLGFGFDGTFNGGDGCNGLNGPYTTAGSQLRFGDWDETLIACEGDYPGPSFGEALRRTAGAAREANRLSLLDADGGVLAEFTAGETSVTGFRQLDLGVWSFITLLGEKPRENGQGARPLVQFSAEGRVTGFDGCSSFDRPVTLADQTMTIGGTQPVGECQFSVPYTVPEDLGLAFDRTRQGYRTLGAEGWEELVLRDADGKELARLGLLVEPDEQPGWATGSGTPGPVTSGPAPSVPGLSDPGTSEPATSEPAPSEPAGTPEVTPNTGPPTVIDQTRWLADAPDEVADQGDRYSCGEELLGQQGELSAEVLDCFTARLGTEDVQFAFTVPTVEGDPIVYFVLGTAGSDRIGIWESTHWDNFGADSWSHRTCAVSAAESLQRLLTCGS